jgi:hypothetical protein
MFTRYSSQTGSGAITDGGIAPNAALNSPDTAYKHRPGSCSAAGNRSTFATRRRPDLGTVCRPRLESSNSVDTRSMLGNRSPTVAAEADNNIAHGRARTSQTLLPLRRVIVRITALLPCCPPASQSLLARAYPVEQSTVEPRIEERERNRR